MGRLGHLSRDVEPCRVQNADERGPKPRKDAQSAGHRGPGLVILAAKRGTPENDKDELAISGPLGVIDLQLGLAGSWICWWLLVCADHTVKVKLQGDLALVVLHEKELRVENVVGVQSHKSKVAVAVTW